ncbi:STAS domain-containing protein [Dactylosporangium sp. CA-139066]|uniref:STAS domain-containing protein n=1 Tax=Dactylosporangium sp. CA-139066 TaxID=3239930 RepID=UPI003D8DFF46
MGELEIATVAPRGAERLVRLSVAGELDAATVPRLRAALADVVGRRPARVELDLAGVTFCSSAAVTALRVAQRAMPGRLVITDARRPVRRVLELCGLTESFGLTPVAQPGG